MGYVSIFARAFAALRQAPPLDEAMWTVRHARLRQLLLAQAVVVVTIAAVMHGWSGETVSLSVVFAACLGLTGWSRVPRRLQQCLVALGLFSVSAGVVQLADGNPVAHFHYFVTLPFLALYEDG